LVIEKNVYSGFYRSGLENYLLENKIDTLIITGVSTDICVQHNVADAFYRGFKSLVVIDGTATIDENTQESALNYMKKIYGAELLDSESIINLIQSSG
jgi:nicotinamidase-related amidase